MYIYTTQKVKDIKYPELFGVVHICYACHSAYTHYTKKLRILNILNFFVYIISLHICYSIGGQPIVTVFLGEPMSNAQYT